MDKPILNFETFELPFFSKTKDCLLQGVYDDENKEEEEDADMVKENSLEKKPNSLQNRSILLPSVLLIRCPVLL